MRLVVLLLAALCMLHAAAARKFFTPETDSEVLHGTVALNVTAHARNAEGKPMLTMHEMHVPVEVEVKKGTQLPEVVHFQNTMTQGRSLQNSYKKLGLPQLAEKIRNFKIKEE